MKILIDIGHPAHVHLFRNFALSMQSGGHTVHFTTRSKEFETELLRQANLPFTDLGRHYRSKAGKVIGLFLYNIKLFTVSIRFRPDLFLSHGSLYTLLSSFLLRRPAIVLEDTGNREQVSLYKPFASVIITPSSLPFRYGKKQVRYDGYHEMAYLHPSYFKPDMSVTGELSVLDNEKYFIVRFVSWEATHDRKETGLTVEHKRELIRTLSANGKTFISSEAPLPPEFEGYRFPLDPGKMHHALAFATLYIGEGLTMAAEAAILGTKAICINNPHPVYSDMRDDYNLISFCSSGKDLNRMVNDILKEKDLKDNARNSSMRLMGEKVDLTAFLVWFVNNYPESVNLVRSLSGIMESFKTPNNN